MFWVVVMLEDKATTQTQFCCSLLEVFFKNLHVSFFLHGSFHLDKTSSSRCTEASLKHNTPTTMFHSGDSVLWVISLTLLSPNISNVSMAKEL